MRLLCAGLGGLLIFGSFEFVVCSSSVASSQSQNSNLSYPDQLNPQPDPLLYPTQPIKVEIADTQPITLQQAIDLALQNNLDIQQAHQQLEQYQAALQEARAANLPTLDASASLTHAESQQQVSSFAEGSVGTTGVSTSLQTTDSNTLSGTLEANYDLFTSGQRSANIHAAETQVRYQEWVIEAQIQETVLDVTNDYYDLQEANEQVRIYTDTLAQAEQSLRDAEAKERAGIGTYFDVLQAQVQVANARQNLVEQRSQQAIAKRTLAQLLNLSQTADVSAADPIAAAGSWDATLQDSILQAFQNRSELQQQLAQREISQYQRRVQLAQLGPQVSLFASYSLNNTLDQETGFTYDYQAGARVSLNLFDGGASRARAAQEEANIAIAETQFSNTRNQIRLQVEQAYLELQSNRENIQTSEVAVQQATEALRLARLRFQGGVGTQSDVLSAQTDLTTAEVNRLQAVLGYNRSLASLRRAIGDPLV
jgi:outer membrane protein TolC